MRQPNTKTSDSQNCPFLQCMWKPKTVIGSSRTLWSGQRKVGKRVVRRAVLIQIQSSTTSQKTVPTWSPETPKHPDTRSISRGQRHLVVVLPLGEILLWSIEYRVCMNTSASCVEYGFVNKTTATKKKKKKEIWCVAKFVLW